MDDNELYGEVGAGALEASVEESGADVQAAHDNGMDADSFADIEEETD
jgi:hypothetical protein